jgi:Asp-tRNA(Asn)/Glu-tRNA(Gln) amidotransferase A subunit family amidase
VAASFATVAIGQDSGGSVRGPAAFNNAVGLRPTFGLVSRHGIMPGTPTRDTLGPITRTVRDAALVMDAIAGYDTNDAATAASFGRTPAPYASYLKPDGLVGMRVGVVREPMDRNTKVDSEEFLRVREAIDRALGDLARRGTEVVDPVIIPSLLDLMDDMQGKHEAEAALNGYLAGFPNAPYRSFQEMVLAPEVLPSRRRQLVEAVGRTTDDPGYLRELKNREALREAVFKVMADNRLDALVYATYDHPPALIPDDILTTPTHKRWAQIGNNRVLSVLIGFPAISVPAGFTPDGLPVGVEFLGRPFSEGMLFSLAYGYEQATQHRKAPPTTPALSS